MPELTPGTVSYAVLWIFVLVQGLVVVALAQRLRRRLTPAWMSPPVGLALPPRSYPSINGGTVPVGGDRDRPTILLFTSPYCAKCQAAAPFLLPFCRANVSRFHIVLFTYGPEDRNRAYARENAIGGSGLDLAVLEPMERREQEFGVRMAPFMLLVDRRGVIVARGPVERENELRQLAMTSRMDLLVPKEAGQA